MADNKWLKSALLRYACFCCESFRLTKLPASKTSQALNCIFLFTHYFTSEAKRCISALYLSFESSFTSSKLRFKGLRKP